MFVKKGLTPKSLGQLEGYFYVEAFGGALQIRLLGFSRGDPKFLASVDYPPNSVISQDKIFPSPSRSRNGNHQAVVPHQEGSFSINNDDKPTL